MTEAEWNRCTERHRMLDFLHYRNRASTRTVRLAACACCRRFWQSLVDGRSRQGVEIAERFADGFANAEEARVAALDAARSAWDMERTAHMPSPTEARRWTVGAVVAMLQPEVDFHSLAWEFLRKAASSTDELRQQCNILRDIFVPSPVRSITLAPFLLQWQDGLIVKLARTAYEERLLPEGTLDTARLMVLADALEEAGFDGTDFLAHLRGRGTHYRGCYVVDALLGKS